MTPSDGTTRPYTATIAATADGGDGIPDLSPSEAVGRWIDRVRNRHKESTTASYDYRLGYFVDWCKEQDISTMSNLTGWDIDEYTRTRGQEVKNVTLNNELTTLRKFLKYCSQIEIVDEDLPEKVEPPEVSEEEDVDDTMLDAEDARLLFEYYEQSDTDRYSRAHALLTLAWFGGPPRLGGIRSLDLNHYHKDEQYIRFHHRPADDTPLKKQNNGERAVGLPEEACEVLDGYIQQRRNDVRDEHGRQPLLTSRDGRPSRNAIRAWMYLATVPCLHSECPHGKDPDTCGYLTYSDGSKCPSSRSPHQVRTGAITWMLNQGISVKDASKRANTSVSVLEKHYDNPELVEEMQKRRRHNLDDLQFTDNEGDSE